MKDTLGALQERFKALKIDGGGLPISRLQVNPDSLLQLNIATSCSNQYLQCCKIVCPRLCLKKRATHLGAATQGLNAKTVALKRITQYNANWVRNQNRMTSTSNQETWRADIEGRIVYDLLRQVHLLVAFWRRFLESPPTC